MDKTGKLGVVLGLSIFLLMIFIGGPESLPESAWRTAAVGILMAIWWVTEPIPNAAVALLPMVLFPILGIATIKEATFPFANPIIYLFLGGFLLAQGMQRWNLHRNLAKLIIQNIGTNPRSLILGFMVAAAFLSMWVSNSATTIMMIPIAASIMSLAKSHDDEDEMNHFATALFLGIAYSASLGGVATLIGTPPNAFLAGYMNTTYGLKISFAQWMAFGVPLTVVSLPIAYFLLARIIHKVPKSLHGITAEDVRASLGRQTQSVAQKRVAAITVLAALMWIFRPLLSDVIPGISDTGIAIFGGLLLFLVPAGGGEKRALLKWEDCRDIPWSVLLLFGGGLSLAAAITTTGLASWIGNGLQGLGSLPVFLLILLITVSIIFLTEVTSNTATAATFIPILSSIAVGISQNPMLLVVPAALAASCAFMLPVATPPNAIAYSTGKVTVPQMVRAGIWMNLTLSLLIVGLVYVLAPSVFDIVFDQVPKMFK
jgi:sodium-dependent dicarboxylate transporter 2/3/5